MSDPDNGDTTLPWSSSRSTLDYHSTPDITNLRRTPVPPNVSSFVNRHTQNDRSLNRSFTRPYATKTVFFYKEGDIYFTGLRVPVSKSRYRTIESLLDDLNCNISIPFGVRYLTTPRGKTIIKNIDQLQHRGRYIASSFKTPRPLNLSVVEKIQRIRRANRIHAPHYYRNNCFNCRKENKNEGSKMRLKLSLQPVTSKQIFFVLNGKPSRIYRMQLNSFRQQTIESLLEEISRGLQAEIFKLYTYSGRRIITMDEIYSLNETRLLAVPRNERPMFRESMLQAGVPPLPSISSTPPSLLEQLVTAKQTIQSTNQENSIERPQRVVSNSKMMPLTSISHQSRRDNNDPKDARTINKMEKSSAFKSLQGSLETYLPTLPISQRSSETSEKATALQYYEDCCDKNNEPATTGIRAEEESCEKSKQIEPESEQETEEHEVDKQKENTIYTEQSDPMAVEDVPKVTCAATPSEPLFDNSEMTSTSVPEADNLSPSAKEDGMTYTVSVITGNRWAADTDLDLFIILYGDLNTSGKHLLRQDTREPKFQQSRMDSFHIETAKLGLLQKIIIGHDRVGYVP
ncbi:unnamed protein product [Litomosoides sigmodontis]|uniref:Doublecortin domain-containing protein n=1 Tax=Litomosoides sigmodontis TaxID=42156 RepID=A0A3P6U253_LITSI|nr:unnamed protein product [Litomosoides sigmodontis]